MALVPSRPIRHLGWEHTSVFRRRPGSDCRWTMTFVLFVSATGIGSPVASARGRPPDWRSPWWGRPFGPPERDLSHFPFAFQIRFVAGTKPHPVRYHV